MKRTDSKSTDPSELVTTRSISIRSRRGLELNLEGGRVTVAVGPDRGLSQAFSEDVLEIGSDRRNDLILSDGSISRRQAILPRSQEGASPPTGTSFRPSLSRPFP